MHYAVITNVVVISCQLYMCSLVWLKINCDFAVDDNY